MYKHTAKVVIKILQGSAVIQTVYGVRWANYRVGQKSKPG